MHTFFEICKLQAGMSFLYYVSNMLRRLRSGTLTTFFVAVGSTFKRSVIMTVFMQERLKFLTFLRARAMASPSGKTR